MKKKSLGIIEIAKKFGISITTVSFILNGKSKEKRISDKLSNKVLEYVKKVNYSPNHLAKSLRTGRTNLIGLIVEAISNPFFANMAHLIEDKLYKRGFRIIYCSSENDTEKARELIKVFRERQVDAYIIIPPPGIEKDIRALIQQNLTVVLFDRFFPDVPTNYVVLDNSEGAYTATNHLIEQGYKNIGFVTLKSDQNQMVERLSGYKKAIKEHHLKSYIKKISFHPQSQNYIPHITSYLRKEVSIDSVVFATNYLGISGLAAIKELDKKIPTDIGVISFDDHELFQLYSPSITVVAQPTEEMANQLITILLNNVHRQDEVIKEKKIVLLGSLVIRKSSLLKV